MRKLLFKMMVAALKRAEDNWWSFVPESDFSERKTEYSLIEFVFNYWVKEELAEEVARTNGMELFYTDVSDFEYFLTKLTYGKAFGLSSEGAKRRLEEGLKNHITPIRIKIEELAKEENDG